MLRRFTLVLIVAIAGCGKPIPAKPDPETPAALETKQENSPRTIIAEAAQVASLIDPAKLATLKERGANSRIQKITAILCTAKANAKTPEEITTQAIQIIGWGGTEKGNLTAAAILRNLMIAERLGAITPADIAAMKKGNAATVRKGPYSGTPLSVDHIIPRSIAPQLDNVVANLELLPLRLNQAKGNKIGVRQRDLARKLHAAGLLERPELPE